MDTSTTATSRLTTTELLKPLVSLDATSRNSNQPLIRVVREHLDGPGVTYRISTDAAEQNANLHTVIGRRQAGGRSHKGKLNLNVMVRGLTSPSGAPSKGVNAARAVGEAIALEVRRLASRLLV